VAATSVEPASDGFADLRDEVGLASLPLSGRLPAWLTGSLVRVAPARWDVGERTLNHWFDGFAMLHRFQISDGNVSYANKFLRTESYTAARDTGKIEFSEFQRPVPLDLQARAVDVLPQSERQHERQPRPAR
jgi:carotenoid cleavage dioxygenase-like enzyme